ncbi:MAG: hypothetical protein DLD55_06300, partial [candidate division SR1 bacterium]
MEIVTERRLASVAFFYLSLEIMMSMKFLRKGFALFAGLVLLSNMLLPSAVVFAEEGAPTVNSQAVSQETQSEVDTSVEPVVSSATPSETQVEAHVQEEETSAQVEASSGEKIEEKTASTPEVAISSEAEKSEAAPKVKEGTAETSTPVQQGGGDAGSSDAPVITPEVKQSIEEKKEASETLTGANPLVENTKEEVKSELASEEKKSKEVKENSGKFSKKDWPSMIPDRSNEGQSFKPGASLRSTTGLMTGGNALQKLVKFNANDVRVNPSEYRNQLMNVIRSLSEGKNVTYLDKNNKEKEAIQTWLNMEMSDEELVVMATLIQNFDGFQELRNKPSISPTAFMSAVKNLDDFYTLVLESSGIYGRNKNFAVMYMRTVYNLFRGQAGDMGFRGKLWVKPEIDQFLEENNIDNAAFYGEPKVQVETFQSLWALKDADTDTFVAKFNELTMPLKRADGTPVEPLLKSCTFNGNELATFVGTTFAEVLSKVSYDAGTKTAKAEVKLGKTANDLLTAIEANKVALFNKLAGMKVAKVSFDGKNNWIVVDPSKTQELFDGLKAGVLATDERKLNISNLQPGKYTNSQNLSVAARHSRDSTFAAGYTWHKRNPAESLPNRQVYSVFVVLERGYSPFEDHNHQ